MRSVIDRSCGTHRRRGPIRRGNPTRAGDLGHNDTPVCRRSPGWGERREERRLQVAHRLEAGRRIKGAGALERSAKGTSGPANPAAATDGDGSRSASR